MDSALNRAVFKLPRDGTSASPVNTASATNLVSGVAFTPAVGSLLVALVYGAVTTDAPSGWTLPAGGSAVNNGGAYLFYRVADAGSATFSFLHNAPNYPVGVAVYEFPAGSQFLTAAAATNLEASDPNPQLTGLTGITLGIAMKGGALGDGLSERTVTWTGATSDFVISEAFAVTDGFAVSVGFAQLTTATWQPTGLMDPAGGATREGITLALRVNNPTPPGGSPVKAWRNGQYVDCDVYGWDGAQYVPVDVAQGLG